MKTVLTIYVGGDALGKGAVVDVFPIPVPRERWLREEHGYNPTIGDAYLAEMHPVSENERRAGVVITSRYAQVQFLYPQDGSYRFNFMPAANTLPKYWDNFLTELIEIGGTDTSGKGPVRTFGFIGDHPSGSDTVIVHGSDISGRNSRGISVHASSLAPGQVECRSYAYAYACSPNAAGWHYIGMMTAADQKRRVEEEASRRNSATEGNGM